MKSFGHFTPQLFHYGSSHYGSAPTPQPEPTAEEKALSKVRRALEAIRTMEANRAEADKLVEEAVVAIRGLRAGLR